MKKLLLLFLLLPFLSQATLIIPPNNMGEFALDSKIIVYGTVIGHYDNSPYQNEMKLLNVIKGDIQTDHIIIDEYSQRIGNLYNDVSGDTDFQVGQNYLLFLSKKRNGHYQANLMALSVFMEISTKDGNVFAHEAALLDLVLIDNGEDISGFKGAYEVNAMIDHLSDIVENNVSWNEQVAGRVYSAAQQEDTPTPGGSTNPPPTAASCPNTAPAHCTMLGGSTAVMDDSCDGTSPTKYAVNAWDIYIAGGASDDPSTTSELTYLTDAIDALNTMPGISVSYAGVDAGFTAALMDCTSPVPTSTPTTGISGDRYDYRTMAATSNDVYVFFDDPCDEIDDLSGCGGVLGRGGRWRSSACHVDICGNAWKNAIHPYLYLNNGVGCLTAGKYVGMLVHEVLHSLSVGHVAGSCSALMNPSICNSPAPTAANNYNISSLDTDCTDWMYAITAGLPIELTSFDASLLKDQVALKWTTASEKNNDFFTIERSANNQDWKMVTEVNGNGDSQLSIDYNTIDRFPLPGVSYYRLKQTDFDGKYTYSDVESVETAIRETIKVIPNPIQSNILNIVNDIERDGDLEAKIYNINGQLLQSASFSVVKGRNNLQMNVNDITAGVYLLETIQNGVKETQRFLIAE